MEKRRTVFSNEMAYVAGILILALGSSLTVVADLGVSMVVAPAYILHLKISQILPFFSFGMAEYTFQALLLIITAAIMRRFKISYLFSFVTAVLYGFSLDGALLLVGLIPVEGIALRIIFYTLGLLLCTFAIALLFRTYISPEAYELFVKELSGHFGVDLHKFKIAYDVSSCLLSILLSFIFFGFMKFEGVKIGTVVSAFLNGFLIGVFSKLLDKLFVFEDRLPLRRFFED